MFIEQKLGSVKAKEIPEALGKTLNPTTQHLACRVEGKPHRALN